MYLHYDDQSFDFKLDKIAKECNETLVLHWSNNMTNMGYSLTIHIIVFSGPHQRTITLTYTLHVQAKKYLENAEVDWPWELKILLTDILTIYSFSLHLNILIPPAYSLCTSQKHELTLTSTSPGIVFRMISLPRLYVIYPPPHVVHPVSTHTLIMQSYQIWRI